MVAAPAPDTSVASDAAQKRAVQAFFMELLLCNGVTVISVMNISHAYGTFHTRRADEYLCAKIASWMICSKQVKIEYNNISCRRSADTPRSGGKMLCLQECNEIVRLQTMLQGCILHSCQAWLIIKKVNDLTWYLCQISINLQR
jgi:hypothetical protein